MAGVVATAVLLLLYWNTHKANAQELTVIISVDYTHPPGFTPGPNEYRAASGPVVVTCTATGGGSGTVEYRWSSTCMSCPFQDSFLSTINRVAVHSDDNGIHTCTATKNEFTANTSIEFIIVGAGIHVFRGASVNRGSQPNNGLVVSDDPESAWRIRFFCRSDSLTLNVGELIGLDGNTFSGSNFLGFEPPEDGGELRVENIVGTQDPLPASEQGVYTCRIPLQSGEIREINIGVYPIGFETPPTIVNPLVYMLTPSSTLTCTSTGSPATTVTFTRDGTTTVGPLRDGESMTVGGVTYQLTQTVSSRVESTYQSSLIISEELSSIVGSVFTCSVANVLGAATSQTLVIRGVNVQITSSQQPLPVGTEAIITCSTDLTATGIEWIDSGGVVVESDTSGQQQLSLVFSPVNDSIHNAEYTCRVTSNATVFNDSIIMTVEVPTPAITVTVTPNPPPSIPTGGFYILTCSAMIELGLTNMPSLQWLDSTSGMPVSGTGITMGTLDQTDTTATLNLTFDPVTPSHGGQYTCLGTLESPAAEETIMNSTTEAINVQISEPIVNVTIPRVPLYAGTIVALSCTIMLDDTVDNAVMVDVTWTAPDLEGGEICNSDYIICMLSEVATMPESPLTFQAKLSFMPLALDNSGNYTCQATANPVPGSEFITASLQGSGVGTVTVQDLPIPEVQVTVDDLSTLTCRATSEEDLFSPPSITWFYSNGTAEQSAVRVDSVNGITVGLPVTEGAVTTQNLTLGTLRTSQEGNYTCMVDITIPEASVEGLVNSASITINVQTPGPVSNVLWVPRSESSVVVSWSTPVIPNGIVIEYAITLMSYDGRHIESQNVNSSTFTAEFSQGLGAGIPYSLSIIAINTAGNGKPATITNFTQELTPPAPRGVTVNRTSGTQMTVSWTPLTLVEARSLIQFYRVFYSPEGRSNKRQSVPICFQSPCDTPGTVGSVLIAGLDSLTSYSVQVAAVNGREQQGNFSEAKIAEALTAISSTSFSTAIIIGAVAVAALVIIGIIVIVLVVIVLRYRNRRAQFLIQKPIRLSDVASSGDDDITIIENVAYAPVDREAMYEVIPGENLPFRTGNVYDPIAGQHHPLNASYEDITEFNAAPVSDGVKTPAAVIRPEDKP